MTERDEIAAIQHRMQEIRTGLDHDVSRIRHQVRRLVDVRYYAHEYPWVSIGIAALIGYLAIPKRPRIVQVDSESLFDLVGKNQFMLQPVQAPTRGRGGITRFMSGFMNAAVKAGKRHVGATVKELAAGHATRST